MTPENYWLQIHELAINDKIEKIYDVLVSNYCYCLMSPKKTFTKLFDYLFFSGLSAMSLSYTRIEILL